MKVPVLIPRIFDHPHTYSAGKLAGLKPGSIVLVPFGKEKEIGVVWDKQEETNRKFKIKDVLETKSISFNENIIKFINWFSLYNLAPKGTLYLPYPAKISSPPSPERITLTSFRAT